MSRKSTMPFNPKFTITPKINKTLVEIERAIMERALQWMRQEGLVPDGWGK